MKILSDDIKIIAAPVLIFLSVFILFAISFKVIFDNISNLNSQVADSKKTESMLQAKLVSLQVVGPEVSQDSQFAISALPSSNSVFATLSEIRGLAQSFTLNLSSIDSGGSLSAGKSQIFSNQISFNVDGTYANLLSFISKIKGSAPISRFDSLRIVTQGGDYASYRLSASLLSFWSALPSALPSIDQPIERLTSDEQAILTNISSLQQLSAFPSQTTNNGANGASAPSFPSGKADPFSTTK